VKNRGAQKRLDESERSADYASANEFFFADQELNVIALIFLVGIGHSQSDNYTFNKP
jgi:hypothetical protein